MARWEEIQTYIVAFDSDGGSAVPDQTVPAGGNAVEPDAPIKSGNLFGEWHLVTGDSMAAEAFDFKEAVNGNITLKARWIPIHTIVFDSNGGSEVGPQAVPAGGKIVQPKVPVKSGNLFAGWHLMTEDGIAAEDFDFSNAVDSDITLKARWIPISEAKILNLPSGLVSVKSGAFIGVESAHAIRLPGNLTILIRMPLMRG